MAIPVNGLKYNVSMVFEDDFEGFVVGEVVSLIVGGPEMVVLSVCECGAVEVAWIKVDGDVMVDAFPEEALYSVV